MSIPNNFDNFSDQEKLDWYAQNQLLLEAEIKDLKSSPFRETGLSQEKQLLLTKFLQYTVDPEGRFYGVTINSVTQEVNKRMSNKVAAIDSVGGINYLKKGLDYDPYLTNFIHGSGGIISDWDRERETDNALVIRGLGGGSRKAIHHCWNTGRTFYAIDTGYFGNGKSKDVHRVTKNALQYLGPIKECDITRARGFGYKYRKFSGGSKILIVPPSDKVMMLYGYPGAEGWVEQVTAQIKQLTDRPIEVRLKPNRTARTTTNTIQAALADDVHCLVTYNSIAAVEALMEGKPAIVLGQNAASVVAETDLSNIENPKRPNKDEMDAYMANLAYQQFTVPELKSGYAWETINAGN